jgi:hypothetical protein
MKAIVIIVVIVVAMVKIVMAIMVVMMRTSVMVMVILCQHDKQCNISICKIKLTRRLVVNYPSS